METAEADSARRDDSAPARAEGEGGVFARKVSSIVAAAEYRRVAYGSEEFEDVCRLRYESYVHSGMMDPDGSGTLDDSYDVLPNGYVFGVYLDGRIASTLRIHHVTSGFPCSPAVGVFPDDLGPRVEAGETFIDPNRFAADPGLTSMKVLPYVTLRLAVAACDHFAADYCLAVVKDEHVRFYERVFRSVEAAVPRRFPGLNPLAHLLHSSCAENLSWTKDRFPFFRSDAAERERLFGPVS